MPRKKTQTASIPDDCMPNCETCNAGVFDRESDVGECHLLPMDWVVVEGDPVLMWKGCYRDGWCRHFERRAH
jgi:hypothetical protein